MNESIMIWIPDYFDLSDFSPSFDNVSISIDSQVFQNITFVKEGRIVYLKLNETVNTSASSIPVNLIITNLTNPISTIKTEYIGKYGIFSNQFLKSYVKLTLYIAVIDQSKEK